ncbi:sperm-associated acrosin inhibitor-like [Myotis yumanensis]|uniref:sperm-associated acrosin inhibitor-like n=1 Tax=Myotis yumanensis TaxID=159337 RepID=UPI0038CF8A9D
MSFFSSWIKVIFITALAFPLYSETALEPPPRGAPARPPPECQVYRERLHACTNEMDPICGTNGHTYYNVCVFCSVMLDTNEAFRFRHYGKC